MIVYVGLTVGDDIIGKDRHSVASRIKDTFRGITEIGNHFFRNGRCYAEIREIPCPDNTTHIYIMQHKSKQWIWITKKQVNEFINRHIDDGDELWVQAFPLT